MPGRPGSVFLSEKTSDTENANYLYTHSDVVGSWFNDEVEVSDVATSAGVPAGVDDGGWGWGDKAAPSTPSHRGARVHGAAPPTPATSRHHQPRSSAPKGRHYWGFALGMR